MAKCKRHRLESIMNNIESHRRYFRSLWKEKITGDLPESTPLVYEDHVPKKKQSKLCKGLRRFRRHFIRELKIICSPDKQREIRRQLKDKKKAEKMKRLGSVSEVQSVQLFSRYQSFRNNFISGTVGGRGGNNDINDSSRYKVNLVLAVTTSSCSYSGC